MMMGNRAGGGLRERIRCKEAHEYRCYEKAGWEHSSKKSAHLKSLSLL
jgi:hypothetical protein